jgi:hypothetical protein
MLICQYCAKECKNNNSFTNHERLCKSNPNRQISSIEKYKKSNSAPWNKGLIDDPRCKHSTETKINLSGGTGKANSIETELVRVAKIKAKINERYASGWEPTCGRCKKYIHISPTAGKIKVDGTWELVVAKYLDKIGVSWERNKKRFFYIKPNGVISTYQPDFYIKDWDSFLEVKGYETDLDRAKWSQFVDPLIVWRKKEIQTLENVLAGS